MNIYVGNLSYDLNDQDLHDIFAEYGTVDSARVIIDKMTGRKRGFGFVEMEDESAKKAIEELDGAEVNGRDIVVNEAKPKEDRPRGGGGGGFRGGNGGGGNRRNF
ncbi:MAG: RNA-binding protein [Candidatus Kapaibacteriales bacterium]